MKTERLELRNFTVEDITPEYINALNDPEVVRLTEARHKKWDEYSVKEYLIDSNNENMELIGIFMENKHLGSIRLHLNRNHKHLGLGIMIWDKKQWGKGIATEALRAIDEYVFNILKFHRIYADYYAINKGSAKIFEKLGYKIEGIYKDHFLLEGEYIDSIRIAKIK